MPLPWYDGLFNPVLQAMKRLGGSASNGDINEEVLKSLDLTEEEIGQMHDERQTELAFRLGWVRTYLKFYGLLENSGRGVWVLTPTGRDTDTVDPLDVNRVARERAKASVKNRGAKAATAPTTVDPDPVQVVEAEQVLEEGWRDGLLATLRAMPPDGFERLCQLLLRESGLEDVRVTGKSGDGGIDGTGVVRLGGLLGFPVIFQCKRYQGSVGSSVVRDFRGAMVGRADRGLLITTGVFTREAKQEAIRDGAPPIDLVEGNLLLDKLKELRLGVKVEMVEKVSIIPEWFAAI